MLFMTQKMRYLAASEGSRTYPECHGVKADPPTHAAELRRRADARLRSQKPPAHAPRSAPEMQRLLHELQVHQIELELQNEELRNSRAQVEAAVSRYADIYDFAPVGYFTLTSGGVITQTNFAGARFLGLERARLLGNRFEVFVSRVDRPAFNALIQHVFAAQAHQALEAELVRKDQPARTMHIEATLSPNGQECHAVVLDITERKQLEHYQERERRELVEGKLHAEQAVREKSAFLANMSHEIRSPMNAILGFSELLEPEGLTPKQSQYVRAIRDSGASLLTLINDILDLSKLEAGKLELHPDPTDIRDSCEFLRTVFRQQVLTKSLQLQFEISPDLPRALLLDRLRLRQVLVNLLGNAIKFTERGGVKLRVSWKSEENARSGTLMIDVEDTGIGIAADKLDEVFKPFVQVDSRPTTEKDGSGIGLTIVKRIMDLMGGVLTVESAVGQGTVFHLQLANVPVSERLPVGDHAEPGGAVDFNDFAPATLLVADDHQANRELIAGIFEKTHHRVHFASNGQEALECLEKTKPDVILLDIRMPVMDGRTTLAEIRRRPGLASLPVIAITASGEASADPEGRSQFSGFIRKPFSRHTLFIALAPFLPRAAQKEAKDAVSSAEMAASIPRPSPEQAAQWRELTLKLRHQEADEWPSLRDSLAINGTRAFARKLLDLAQAAPCNPLATYAATLISFADGYAIGQMESHLAAFPKLIESIERSSS
jgi:PAS domain S-box-containing protein